MLNNLDHKILMYILEEKRPISNKELALQCDVAINTIRKEIGLINEEAEKHGFYIASKTSVGNYIEIVDQSLAGPYIEKLWDSCKRNRRMDNEYPAYIYYLTRKCLCCSGQITAEELCQELYCSRGTIFRYFNSVKDILAGFDLTFKNRRGVLAVEGDEWSIRQCLIYLHKIYKMSLEDAHFKDTEFKTLFFMLGGETLYEEVRQDLVDCLLEQQDFSMPLLYFPKIMHYMQLSVSRHKQTENIRFTEEQIQRARNTAEYRFAQKMYERFAEKHHIRVSDRDVLALSMLLLSQESQNYHLKSMPEYEAFYAETLELIGYLCEAMGCPRETFDEIFIEDWISFLYRLKNRLIFHIYSDWEAYGYVKRKGIRTSDFCLCFARFYEEKHGIRLDRGSALSPFYVFNRLLKMDQSCYYAQQILVLSQYGVACAKLLALNIRNSYGKEVKAAIPAEVHEYVEEEPMDFDLILTDISGNRKRYLAPYKLPILQVEFLPFQMRCPELDTYLEEVQKNCEWTIIKSHCFHYTNLKSKEAVFQYLGDLFSQWGVEREAVVRHLRENDSYVELERENGVVFLPVLTGGMQLQHFAVLINQTAFTWNKSRSQIFVCYNRLSSHQANQMLSGVLRKFVHISAETADLLIHSNKDPLKLLYPNTR